MTPAEELAALEAEIRALAPYGDARQGYWLGRDEWAKVLHRLRSDLRPLVMTGHVYESPGGVVFATGSQDLEDLTIALRHDGALLPKSVAHHAPSKTYVTPQSCEALARLAARLRDPRGAAPMPYLEARRVHRSLLRHPDVAAELLAASAALGTGLAATRALWEIARALAWRPWEAP